jgi:arginase
MPQSAVSGAKGRVDPISRTSHAAFMVDIKILGLPTDCNSSFERGPASAPDAIRAALLSDRGNMSTQLGPEIGADIPIDDLGDLALNETTVDHDTIMCSCSDIARTGAIPILLGGDHSVTWPIVAGLAAVHGPVTILHFDAHPDIYADFEGNPRSHASPFARIMEAGLASRLVQIGIRTLTQHCREQAHRYGVEILPMAGFTSATVPSLDGPLYISIDLDGIDPSEAPGVSHPEPGGLTVREVLAILHMQSARIVGADIVELNPRFDRNDMTAILAAKLLREVASVISRNAQ